ncbi:tripartite tricarboxylate transporter TctB family protein [Bosea psychrotolerans]|uniref:Tripartite tricarboxylate transporter TctB family protein n=1 Tax=Bosea psychrotolerans TaxID=1871628 RepID=A0A2S4M049_9HYPH|nr:tripartite tricarboxylate transporter TctB family protein [Bosea psychrotolerans]POR48091.1 tripartite tricarboxylate transporter TctB family protein [Bosea psychrotolerans]
MSLNPIERAQGLRIRSQQDMAAGLFMVALGVFAFLLSGDLPLGSLRQIGPGMLPKSFAVICAVLGLMLSLASLRFNGEKLTGWAWRGVFLVLGGACLFGLAIRGFDIGPIHVPQLGLLVAGPLVILVSGLAADDMKWKELIIFAIAMTTACALLFKYALSLPIPLAPWLLGI